MREEYWYMFIDFKFKELYYTHYQRRTKRLSNWITAAGLITSVSSIAGWSLWSFLPSLWGLLIAASQLLQVLKPLMPFSDQLVGLRFALPKFSDMLVDIEHDWRRIDLEKLTDDAISKLMRKYQVQYRTINSTFLDSIDYPDCKKCIGKADADNVSYFKLHYNQQTVEKVSEANVEDACTTNPA